VSETQLLIAILEALAVEPGVVAWRNAQVTARRSGRAVKAGLGTGSADIIACVGPNGRFLGLEVKLPGEELSEAQKWWWSDVADQGGAYAVVHSVDEARRAVQDARR
jgi:hypothetical protein